MTPILELRNVSKRFGGLAAVKNVSFTMNEGEIVFVIGPNGAGKTTVFNLVSGFLHPNEGTILDSSIRMKERFCSRARRSRNRRRTTRRGAASGGRFKSSSRCRA